MIWCEAAVWRSDIKDLRVTFTGKSFKKKMLETTAINSCDYIRWQKIIRIFILPAQKMRSCCVGDMRLRCVVKRSTNAPGYTTNTNMPKPFTRTCSLWGEKHYTLKKGPRKMKRPQWSPWSLILLMRSYMNTIFSVIFGAFGVFSCVRGLGPRVKMYSEKSEFWK